MIPADARLLRLYVNSDDRFEGRPLFEAVVTKARRMGMAGASAFPVEMSFGSHHRLHDQMSEYLFVSIPVVIEVIDAPERIDSLLTELRMMVGEGLATINPARVVHYVHGAHANGHRG
jgi:PII-like signaling protein